MTEPSGNTRQGNATQWSEKRKPVTSEETASLLSRHANDVKFTEIPADTAATGKTIFFKRNYIAAMGFEPWGFSNCCAGPGAFSDRGCLLLQAGLCFVAL